MSTANCRAVSGFEHADQKVCVLSSCFESFEIRNCIVMRIWQNCLSFVYKANAQFPLFSVFATFRFQIVTMKKRVLIISTSAGTGHVRAGEALTKVFEEHPMVGEVVHSDALDFTNKVFRDFYSKLYARLVQDRARIPRLVVQTKR